MRAAFIVLALGGLLAGCHREPSFDERYDTANKTIADRVKAIDGQIAGTAAPPVDEEGDEGGN